MPTPTQDLFPAAPVPPYRVELEPAHNAINSLALLEKYQKMSGFSEWVPQTLAAMTPEERRLNTLVLDGLYYAVVPMQSWTSFPAFLSHLESLPPLTLRDKLLTAYARVPVAYGED
jgi:hypothetical protein